MGKEQAESGSMVQELFQTGLYKRSQGRATRQVTFAAIAIAVCVGAYKLTNILTTQELAVVKFGVPALVLVAGLWLCYRIVNLNRFADFLIAVEAEMNKVTWPTRTELFRSSMVVMIVIFSLAGILFFYDAVWTWFFQTIGVLYG